MPVDMPPTSLANKGTDFGGTKPLHEFVPPKTPPEMPGRVDVPPFKEPPEFARPNRMPAEGINPTGPLGKPATTPEAFRTQVGGLVKESDIKAWQKIQKTMQAKTFGKRIAAGESAMAGKSGEDAVIAFKSQLKGKMPNMDVAPLGDALHPQTVSYGYDLIKNLYKDPFTQGGKRVQAWDAWKELVDNGKLPTKRESELLRPILGDEVTTTLALKAEESAAARRGLLGNLWDGTVKLVGTERAIRTSGDLSAKLNQCFITATSQSPVDTAKQWYTAIKSIKNPEVAEAVIRSFDEHELSPVMHILKEKGYDTPDVLGFHGSKAAKILEREEFYDKTYVQKIWGVRTVVNASERDFCTTTNLARYGKYFSFLKDWEKSYPDIAAVMKQGKDPFELIGTAPEFTAERVGKALKEAGELGKCANIITGRGDLMGLKDHAQTLNVLLFASKKLAANVEYLPWMFAKSWGNPVIRKEFAKELVGMTATAGAIYLSAKACGADVELDPRSADWGKIRIGDTRIALGGGLQPLMRYTAQIISGQRKNENGEIVDIKRGDTFLRFLRSKESPVMSVASDIITGRSFLGEKTTLSKETAVRLFRDQFSPMFIQDIKECIKQEGPEGALYAAPGILGASVVSYNNTKPVTQAVVKPISQEQIIENQAWAQYPYWKTINDQIKAVASVDPEAEAKLLKKYPKLVQIRKEIASRKRMLKGRSWQNKT
jgi:hypothetical protein